MSTIQQELEKRVLVIDGAMGSMIQQYKLTEKDFRGKRFADWHKDLQGNNDLLSITQPQIIKTIHKEYLKAGADIIETNTFSDTTIAMADYDMQEFVYELNFESAKIAKEAIAVTKERSIHQREYSWLERSHWYLLECSGYLNYQPHLARRHF